MTIKYYNYISNMDQIPKAKVVVLGEGRVGKTSITIIYWHNKFDDK